MENKEKAAASRLIKKYSIILILIALMIVLTMIAAVYKTGKSCEYAAPDITGGYSYHGHDAGDTDWRY